MKLTTKLATFAAVTLMASNAMAFSLAGDYKGPIKFKYSNFESLITGAGQDLFGIFSVTTINADNTSNKTLWASSDAEELTGEFYDYRAANITPITGGQAIDFTGGIVNLYLDSTPNFDANPYTGNRATSGTGVTDGILFLSFKGSSGFVANDPTTAFDESTDTLRSTVDALTTPFTGKGFGNLEITGGAYADFFGGIGAIMTLNSDLASPDPQGSQWPVGSEDPLRGTAVPEPGTVALVGLGLAGIALANRKRMTK